MYSIYNVSPQVLGSVKEEVCDIAYSPTYPHQPANIQDSFSK